MHINVGIKWLLDNDQETIYKENDITYFTKAKITDDLYALFKLSHSLSKSPHLTDITFSFSSLYTNFIGIYSRKKGDFVLLYQVFGDYLKNVIIGDTSNLNYLTANQIQKEFEKKVITEMVNIFKNQNVNYKSDDYLKEIRHEAMTYLRNGKTPQFKMEQFCPVISFDNLEDILYNTEDYAFELAEKYVLNDTENIVFEFTKYLDILDEIELLKQSVSEEILIEKEILGLKNKCKTVTVYIEKDGTEIVLNSYKTEYLYMLPIFYINRIVWKNKDIYNKDNYTPSVIQSLRSDVTKNIAYYKDYIENKYEADGYFSYLSTTLLNDFNFMKYVIKNNPRFLGKVGKTLRNDTMFIDYLLYERKLSIENILSIIGIDAFLYFSEDILDFINPDKIYHLNVSEDIANSKEAFILLLKKLGPKAFHLYKEDFAKDLAIKKEVEDLISSWNLDFSYFNHNSNDWNLNLITDEDLLLNLVTNSTLCLLPDKFKSDIKFVFRIIEKMKSSKNFDTEKCNYSFFVSNFKSLEDNIDFCTEVSKFTKMEYSSVFTNIPDKVKKDKNFQFTVGTNPNITCQIYQYFDDDVKDKIIKNDFSKFDFCYPEKVKWTEDMILEVAKLSINCTDSKLLVFKKIFESIEKDLKIKVLKINPYIYYALNITDVEDFDIAYAVTETHSIIPYIKNNFTLTLSGMKCSLFDNMNIMLRCLNNNPTDFNEIPKTSNKFGKAILLEDKNFCREAVLLDKVNIYGCESQLLKDGSFLKHIILDNRFDLSDEYSLEIITDGFLISIFRDETFVYDLLDELIKKCKITTNKVSYSKMINNINNSIIKKIPQKIKNSSKFKTTYPMFV